MQMHATEPSRKRASSSAVDKNHPTPQRSLPTFGSISDWPRNRLALHACAPANNKIHIQPTRPWELVPDCGFKQNRNGGVSTHSRRRSSRIARTTRIHGHSLPIHHMTSFWTHPNRLATSAHVVHPPTASRLEPLRIRNPRFGDCPR